MADSKQPRSPLQTRWTALHAVASELYKRNYKVTFNERDRSRLADLTVMSPLNRTVFQIDVKGLYLPNSWTLRKKAEQKDFFYIFAFVPTDDQNQFFIADQAQVNIYIDIELIRLKRTPDYKMPGVTWKQIAAHTNAWDVLPT